MNPCPDVLPAIPLPPALSPGLVVHSWLYYNWPWLIILAVMGLVGWYEIWATKTGRETITEWLKRHATGWKHWLRVIGGAALIGVTMWHLIFGGPFKQRQGVRQ